MKQVQAIDLPDGSRTAITIFREELSDKAPLLLLFPAMGVEASYYQPFAEALVLRGWIAVSADLRGLGHSSVRPKRGMDYGYEEMVQLDYRAIFDEVLRRFPSHPLYVMGHSLGGQLACLFLSRYRVKITGLILIASSSVHYSGWKWSERWRLLFGLSIFPLAAHLLGYHAGDKLGFGGRAGRRQILDWCQQGRSGKYRLRGSDFDYEKALEEWQIPVLAISVEGDTFAPPKAMKNLYQKLHPASPISLTMVTKANAQNPRLNHFNWARQAEATIDLIEEWRQKEG